MEVVREKLNLLHIELVGTQRLGLTTNTADILYKMASERGN
jgi:hypothetical protein